MDGRVYETDTLSKELDLNSAEDIGKPINNHWVLIKNGQIQTDVNNIFKEMNN